MMLRKILFWGLIIAVFSVCGAAAESVAVYAAPNSARIGGTVTVNGVLVTQATDSGYKIAVTKPDGSEYNPIAQDADGINSRNYYIINIPIWHSVDQPGVAHPGETAVIHVYKGGLELSVTSPENGRFTIGDSGSTSRIPLKVQTKPCIIQRQTMEDIESAPVNLGSVATGGNSMGLAIKFPAYAGPVDIWVAIQLPDKTLIFLDSAYNLTFEWVPFEVGVTKANVATIIEEFEICSRLSGANVPEGPWRVFWLVAPANGGRIDFIDFDKGPYELDFYGFDLRCK